MWKYEEIRNFEFFPWPEFFLYLKLYLNTICPSTKLEKIEALEEKIKTEMVTLKEKMGKMNEDMKIFSDIDRYKANHIMQT